MINRVVELTKLADTRGNWVAAEASQFQITSGVMRVTDPCYTLEIMPHCIVTIPQVVNGDWQSFFCYDCGEHGDYCLCDLCNGCGEESDCCICDELSNAEGE